MFSWIVLTASSISVAIGCLSRKCYNYIVKRQCESFSHGEQINCDRFLLLCLYAAWVMPCRFRGEKKMRQIKFVPIISPIRLLIQTV